MTEEVRDEEGRGPEPDRLATERAEELVDRMARSAGYLVSFVGLHVLKGASLAREEAEDIWAEAQSLRQRREGQGAEPGLVAPEAGGGAASGTVEATEAARRKAEEMGVDLTEVRGTGADGRITVEDVKKRAKPESP